MKSALALLPALALLLAGAPARAEGQAFKVVVHPSNPASSLPRAQVSQLFLKKVTRWPDGRTVKPVEPPASSRTRESFCESVHGKSLSAVKSYWHQLIFTGRDVPPIEKSTDDEILAFVRANETAIGVVSAGTPLAGVKMLDVK